MDSNHRYILSIPLNVDNLDNIPDGVLWEDIKFEDFMITKGDYNNLFPLFCQFDKPLGSIIDEYEEEEIPASKIQAAIEMTEKYAATAPSEVRASTEKLLAAFRRAKELGKPIEFFF
ncbi:MAG: hypothetical protein K5660_05945 [Paludibacteraceae bacterium]|nr:hypothetical protein [Paludibacteraceae bacterium]